MVSKLERQFISWNFDKYQDSPILSWLKFLQPWSGCDHLAFNLPSWLQGLPKLSHFFYHFAFRLRSFFYNTAHYPKFSSIQFNSSLRRRRSDEAIIRNPTRKTRDPTFWLQDTRKNTFAIGTQRSSAQQNSSISTICMQALKHARPPSIIQGLLYYFV